MCFGAASDPLLGQGGAFKLQRHRAQSSRFVVCGRHGDPRDVGQLGELAAQGITGEGFAVTLGSEHGDIQGEPSQAGIVPASNSDPPWSCVPQADGDQKARQRNWAHTGHKSSFRTRRALVDRLKTLLRCRGQRLMGRFGGRTILKNPIQKNSCAF